MGEGINGSIFPTIFNFSTAQRRKGLYSYGRYAMLFSQQDFRERFCAFPQYGICCAVTDGSGRMTACLKYLFYFFSVLFPAFLRKRNGGFCPGSGLLEGMPQEKEGDTALFYDYPALEGAWAHSVTEEPDGAEKVSGEKREEVAEFLERLREDSALYGRFLDLPPRLRKEFLDFCTGQKGVKITYDPFFRFVFNPELHPERLERLLSSILKEKVRIRRVLPPDPMRFHESMPLVIMDILVELAGGALCSVEIQKAPYAFPGQRAACCSSELVVRQYSRERQKAKTEGIPFSYHNLSRVYTVVLLEKSSGDFCRYSDHYVHRAAQVFDTGLSLNLLQEYVFISLDIFRTIVHEAKEEPEAWLMFLSSDDPADIARVTAAFPEFAEYYREIADLRENPKELIGMFGRTLAEMDRDEYFGMMEQLREDVKNLSEQTQRLKKEKESLEWEKLSVEKANRSLADEKQNLEEQIGRLLEQRKRMTGRL